VSFSGKLLATVGLWERLDVKWNFKAKAVKFAKKWRFLNGL
jgi:hypothetical protein